MVDTFDSWVQHVGPFAYLLLFLAALLEYVFPPFPGDTIVLLGGIYAVRGEKSWLLVFAAVTLGSVVGSAFDYFIGKKLASRIERNSPGSWWGKSADRLHQLQGRMRTRGTSLLLLNRFLPAVRALIFVAAGAAGLPFPKTVMLGAISAACWNLLLMGLGSAVGGNAERLEGLVRRYHFFVYALVAIALVFWLARAFWRRKRPVESQGSSRTL